MIIKKGKKLEKREEQAENAIIKTIKNATVLITGSVLRIPEKAIIIGTLNERNSLYE